MTCTESLWRLDLDLCGALSELAVPVYLTDREGRFRWFNEAARNLVGDLVGEPFTRAIAPDHRHVAKENFARKIVGEGATAYELAILSADGERVLVRINSAPLREGGMITGVLGVAVPLPGRAGGPAATPGLTPRQHEVLRLLGEGLETEQVAARLGIADETARNHIRALLRQLGAHSRLEAVVTAYRLGLLAPADGAQAAN
jgi:PAS domain S-box-containing protein